MKMLFLLVLLSLPVFAQTEQGTTVADIQKVVNETLASKWYERIQLRGYAHFRYNRFMESNDKYLCSQCDASIGKNQGFFFRRARLTFYGDVTDRVFIYIQPDYSQSATNGSLTNQQNYLNLRDAYFDYAFDEAKEFRVRTGLSKVPFGFDNLQSSGNRAALDRSDAINMAAPNERDMGVFFMYAPAEIRKMFKELTANNLKGTGDYGMIAIGAYNGQSMNRAEQNNDLHRVVRVTVPWKTQSGQYFEASLQAYEGKFDIIQGNNIQGDAQKRNYYDARQGASFVMYPQPFGFQAEYNIGTGPEFDPQKGATGRTSNKNLKGGYAQVMYQHYIGNHRFHPYLRYQEYTGGRKIDGGTAGDSPARAFTSEMEVGTEWQPNPAIELTAAYAKGTRLRQSTAADKLSEQGQYLRLQAQFNY